MKLLTVIAIAWIIDVLILCFVAGLIWGFLTVFGLIPTIPFLMAMKIGFMISIFVSIPLILYRSVVAKLKGEF